MIKIVGWFGGYLGIISGEIGNRWKNLDNFYFSWEEKGKKLDSFVKLDRREFSLDEGTQLILGTVYYEFLRTTKEIIKKGGKFKITDGVEVLDTGWSNFWLTNKSFILINKKLAKVKVFEIISNGLFGTPENIDPISFNIEEISIAHPRQWLGGFRDREGNIHSGTFYGEDILNDMEMGTPYQRTTNKNQVGIFTEYFGPEIKIKVTRQGYVLIYRNLNEDPQIAFEFIRDELNGYILSKA